MNKVFSQFGISTACIFITTFSASALDLQPSLTTKPLECKMSEGHFILDKTVAIFAGEFKTEAEYLEELIFKSTKISMLFADAPSGTTGPFCGEGIEFFKKEGFSKEGYHLKVTKKGITIEASTSTGASYAIKALLKSLPNEVRTGKPYKAQLKIPLMDI